MQVQNLKFFRKIFQYEFWPYWIFYAPFIPLWFYYSIKNKSFLYFTAVNPKLKYGGFIEYSKNELLEPIPLTYKPKTFIITIKENVPLEFPFIAKPDIGERGVGVELVDNEKDWEEYLQRAQFPLLIQEYINEPFEYGLFYYQLPDQTKIQVLGITGKTFLSVIGNGKDPLSILILNNFRANLRKDYLYKKFKSTLNSIPKKNQEILLEEIGNHNRGTYFYDATGLLTEKILDSISKIVSTLPSFYYGRLDVKAKSISDFKNGNFKVLEINGSNSEATHLFDTKYSLLQAYKIVYKKLNIQAQIAQQNIKKGYKTESLFKFVKELYVKLWT